MIVTIDGPAGAGKSTVARRLAQRLGFEFLDTGAMYRAVALAVQRGVIGLDSEIRLHSFLASMRLEMPPGGRVFLNKEDVTHLIRTPEITRLSRPVADHPAIRRRLSELQRRFATDRNFVTEGRDQGTIVFPDALCKFFVTAQAEERARRRQTELTARGDVLTLEQVLQAQTDRDAADAGRVIAPMTPAPDAITVDTTGLSIEEVVNRLERQVRERLSAAAGS